MDEGEAAAQHHGNCSTCDALMLPELVRVHSARGARDIALVAVEKLEAIALDSCSLAWTAMAKQARGRYLKAVGDQEAAGVVLCEAEEAYATYGDVYEAARCRLARSQVVSTPKLASDLESSARKTLTRLGVLRIEGESTGSF